MRKKTSDLVPYWLLEAVRLKESQWGPIEDAVEVRRAIAAGGSLEERLLMRAQLLSQREQWSQKQQGLWRFMRWSLGLVFALFLILGTGAALGALNATDGRVNILWAVLTLLALPSFSLLVWLIALLFSTRSEQRAGIGVSQLWLWLSQRIVKGPDQALLFNAYLNLLIKQRLAQWLLSVINHAAWVLGLMAMLVTLLLLLAAKRYSFNWETTLLSADNFVLVVQALGWLPGWLGFSTPSPEMIRLSDGLQTVPSAVQVQWSSWLVGCVLVYGLLPRLVALGACYWQLRKNLRQLHVNTDQVGLIELRPRLMPVAEYVGVDAVAGVDQVPVAPEPIQRPAVTAKTLVVGVELSPDQPWPPFSLPVGWQDAGLIDSREQRAELLTQLTQHAYAHVVLCVDAAQTPDRGVMAWLAELASYSDFASVYLINAGQGPDRLDAWRSRLKKADFESVYTDINTLFFELHNHHES
ncbi:DUF2868 domain-containing protein [Paenalcaligenes hominis]|uniref:DUF2868 domain-containing protein n=1 Tax=Paenalcaligenes hominis TaxID=643674 RepID=UPI0035254556